MRLATGAAKTFRSLPQATVSDRHGVNDEAQMSNDERNANAESGANRVANEVRFFGFTRLNQA
jgi:hypothetical protein